MGERPVVVIVSYYNFKQDNMQQVIENVFAKELGKHCRVIFLFTGDVKDKYFKWHNAEVIITGNYNFFGRYLPFKKFYYLMKIICQVENPIILVRDLTFNTTLLIILKRFFNFKLFFQYSAPLGDMDIGYFKKNKSLKRYYYLAKGIIHNVFLKIAIKKADQIFPITASFGEKLCERYSCSPTVPITMGVDEQWLAREVVPVSWLDGLISTNHFLIGYFGSLSFLRNPDFILRVFADLKNKIAKSKLILMGDVAQPWEKKELLLLCRRLNIDDDVIFTGKLDRNTLQDYLVYCKLSVCPIPLDSHYRISSPTKLYESLGNGIPVIANKGIYEHEKVLTESKGGLLVDYNVEDFSSAVQYLYKNPMIREKMGEDGRKYVISHYSYQRIAEKLIPYFMYA